MPILNKAGYPSTRNKDKPYRPARVIVDKAGNVKPHPMDSMGSTTHRVANSTGCFGTVGGSINIRVKMYGPRKGRRNDKKPKRGCRLASTGTITDMVEGTTKKHHVFGCKALFPKISLNGERQAKPLVQYKPQKTRHN